jgi:hypothetical protein
VLGSSTGFHKFYEVSDKSALLNGEHITNILNILQARADFEGVRKDLELRVSKIKEGPLTIIYYDLANKAAVKITATATAADQHHHHDGWTIEQAPIIFRRYSSQKPQVYPVREYPKDIFDKFMSLINISGDDNKLLLKCYIISMFYPDIIKPALMLHGAKGCQDHFSTVVKNVSRPKPCNDAITSYRYCTVSTANDAQLCMLLRERV